MTIAMMQDKKVKCGKREKYYDVALGFIPGLSHT
jgi:hypothetical protein